MSNRIAIWTFRHRLMDTRLKCETWNVFPLLFTFLLWTKEHTDMWSLEGNEKAIRIETKIYIFNVIVSHSAFILFFFSSHKHSVQNRNSMNMNPWQTCYLTKSFHMQTFQFNFFFFVKSIHSVCVCVVNDFPFFSLFTFRSLVKSFDKLSRYSCFFPLFPFKIPFTYPLKFLFLIRKRTPISINKTVFGTVPRIWRWIKWILTSKWIEFIDCSCSVHYIFCMCVCVCLLFAIFKCFASSLSVWIGVC